jgi:methylmalonyl-CoA mutase N-terminal domain/subunit
VLGGTQSLHTNSRDEALTLPSEKSAQIALRTQQVIAYESGVADSVDPLGGAYFLESLTDRIEEMVMEYLQTIENLGGMRCAIETGFVQKEIQESAFQYQKQIENKERIIVSLNAFADSSDKIRFNLHTPPKEVEKNQLKKLERLKAERPEEEVKQNLHALRQAAQEGQNVFPPILEAVRTLATLEEITSVLRKVYGTYQENIDI